MSLTALVLDCFVLAVSFDFARGPSVKPLPLLSVSSPVGPVVSGLEGEDEEPDEPNFLTAVDLNGAGPLRLDLPLTAGDRWAGLVAITGLRVRVRPGRAGLGLGAPTLGMAELLILATDVGD